MLSQDVIHKLNNVNLTDLKLLDAKAAAPDKIG
jgi:hypothetical protein